MSLRTFYNQFIDALGRRGVEAGKLWVEKTLIRLAGESNLQVENISWKGPSDDPKHFDRLSYSICFSVGGKGENIAFFMDDIEDCVSDKATQLRMESKIREKIASLKH